MGHEMYIDGSSSSVEKYGQYGAKVVEECQKALRNAGINNVWTESNNMHKTEDTTKSDTDTSNGNQNDYKIKKHKADFTSISNPTSGAFTKLVNFSSKNKSAMKDAGKAEDAMDDISHPSEKHQSFMTEKAPEGGIVSGIVQASHEFGTDGSTTTVFAGVENRWQNKNEDIYTKFSAEFGKEQNIYDNITYNSSANISFAGRYKKDKSTYVAGVDYNSQDNTKVLDIYASGKLGNGMFIDATRRTTFKKMKKRAKMNLKVII